MQTLKEESKPIIWRFLNRKVKVKISDSLEVQGLFVGYQTNSKVKHNPQILILKDDCGGFHILRGNWLCISEASENG